jgi:hypothetical protein
MVVFVKQQQILRLLPLVLHVVENYIGVKVFALGCIVVPIGIKVDCPPILNMLWLDSKKELV